MPRVGSKIGRKHVSCPECNFVSRSHVSHIEHFKLHHPFLKPYTCTATGCNRSFGSRSHLKNHMITHEVTRPLFTCPFCQRQFLNESGVVAHVRNLHPVEQKVFKCSFEGCTFATRLAKYLATHSKMHSSSRQEFKCNHPGCDAKYFCKKSLIRHLQKIHDADNKNKTELKCAFCTDTKFTCNFCKAFSSRRDQDVLIELPLIELPLTGLP